MESLLHRKLNEWSSCHVTKVSLARNSITTAKQSCFSSSVFVLEEDMKDVQDHHLIIWMVTVPSFAILLVRKHENLLVITGIPLLTLRIQDSLSFARQVT